MYSEDSTTSTMTPPSPASSEGGWASKYAELQEKFDCLQTDYEEKCNELVECENDLKAAKVEIQELQILLKSQTGEQRSSIVPDKIEAGNSGISGALANPGELRQNPQAEELRRMFFWLAQQVELEEVIQFDASGHHLTVGDHQVRMEHICQWRLKDSDLRLTVPHELACEISSLLGAAKTNPNILCEARAQAIMDSWVLSTNEPPAETCSAVTLLTHRQNNQINCIVANFPAPHPILEFAGFRVGEIVEVNFEGEWFIGFIKVVKNDGEFSIQCDVDDEGVLTLTSVSFLRRPANLAAPEQTPEETDAPQVPEVEQSQPQVMNAEVATNPTLQQSQAPRHKTAFSHARTFSCP